jgi:anthranilate synthase component 1
MFLSLSSPRAYRRRAVSAEEGPEGRRRFFELAAQGVVVPVWRELIADTVTPVGAFTQVVGDEPGFLLESVEGGDRWGRYSFVGRRPLASIVSRGLHVEISGELELPVHVRDALDSGVLAALEELLDAFGAPLLEGLPPLHSGFVGYLGYDVVREVEHLPNIPEDDLGLPDSAMFLIGQLCAFDHWRQRVVLVQNVPVPPGASDSQLDSAYDLACERLDELAHDLFRPMSQPALAVPGPRDQWPDVARTMSPDFYESAVVVAKEHISAGDVFQVVLSQRFDLDLGADPFDVYRVLRQVNPSPYLYFVRNDSCTVLGSSPEPMVRLRDRVVTSRPIAGTRPRGSSEHEDAMYAAELVEHPKEGAEHIMLVDLARNDVGRVVRFGTERVEELMTLERYSHVMHLTSQVSGELAEGKGPIDVLRATMPAGTLSGAPKVRAMQIIDDLEPTKRGVYGGVVGYLDLSGNLDTAIAIRTMVVTPDGRASVQAGAGIVADSDPAQEQVECENKAATILSAVRAARRVTASRLELAASGDA